MPRGNRMAEDLLVPVVIAAGIVVAAVVANLLARAVVVALQLVGPLFLGTVPGEPKHGAPTIDSLLLRLPLLAFRRVLREMLLRFGRVGGQMVRPQKSVRILPRRDDDAGWWAGCCFAVPAVLRPRGQ